MSKKIVFVNEKGGVGKSSACFNVAWELSKKYRVLIVDLDGQRANVTFFCGIKKSDQMITMCDVLQTKRNNITEAILPVKENLDIVPANEYVVELSQKTRMSYAKEVLPSIDDRYDYIFIDVNPTPNWSQAIGLSMADAAIIVMLPDVASLEANMGMVESVLEIQSTSNAGLKILGILMNKYNSRTNLGREALKSAERMAEALHTKVLKSKIRNSVSMSENIMEHIGITDYDPSSTVAKDIRQLCKEIEEWR